MRDIQSSVLYNGRACSMGKASSKIESGNTPSLLGISSPWAIAALGCILFIMSSMNSTTFGVFFKPIAGDFGWSRGAMSASFGIRSAVCALLAAPVGYLSDRYGPRWVMIGCSSLAALGFLALARIDSLWQLYLVQGLVMGIASSGAFVCITSTVARWHKTRRGLALAIASSGFGLSSVIFPPVATKLIESVGWQGAMIVMGILVLAIAIPASLLFRDPPRPDKETTGLRVPRRGPFYVWGVLLKLARNSSFMGVVVMMFILYFATSLVPSHLVNYVTDIGLGAVVGAAMLSLVGAMNTAGRFVLGPMSDRYGTRIDIVVTSALLTVSLVLLTVKVPAWLWLSVVVFGIGSGGVTPLITAVLGERFGTEHLGTATGAAMAGAYLGSAVGPFAGGVIFDFAHSYFWALILAGATCAVSVAIGLWLPRAEHESWQRGRALLK